MDQLHLEILLPAMLAGIIVISTHVPLGREVLKRGIIFIDLAIAQIAGLGVIAATYVFDESPDWVVQVSAITAALLGASLFNWIERHWIDLQEALIGVFFVLAATASILLLASDPHAGEHMKELLVGQILWVSWEQLLIPGLASTAILFLWVIFRQRKPSWLFYGLFAIAITASVQLVGVYLVFASLIIPALTVSRVNRNKMLVAYVVGFIGYMAGLLGSSIFDLPSGPMIVWSLALSGLAVSLLLNLKHA
jgi:zinc/manganese transport system permease protein